ncbi:MAG: Ni/Fe-hydrogenase, b-type cytochrome subunit [bacterium]
MADRKMKYVWSGTVRIIHWTIFLSVVVLLITGNYIAHTPSFISPDGEPAETFFMAQMRFIHFVAAIVFDVAILLSIYLIFFSTFHAPWKELLPTPRNLKKFWIQLKYYFKLSGENVKYEYEDPIDIISFLSFHILAILLIFTGFALYVVQYAINWWWPALLHFATDWIVALFGGLQNVRSAHHIMWWLILVWFVIHVYFQIWKSIKFKTGNINAIISGYRLER